MGTDSKQARSYYEEVMALYRMAKHLEQFCTELSGETQDVIDAAKLLKLALYRLLVDHNDGRPPTVFYPNEISQKGEIH